MPSRVRAKGSCAITAAVALATALLLTACGGQPTKPMAPLRTTAPTPSTVQTVAPPWTVDEGIARYEAGLDLVGKSLQARSAQSTALAREVFAFRAKRVHWATLDGESFIALQGGAKADGWLVLIPPTHPLATSQKNTYESEPRNPIAVVRILPVRIAERWAGVFAMHEISHLMDRVTGVEPMGAPRDEFLRGEVRAVRVEMEVADAVSAGKFGTALDALVEGYRATDAKQCFEHSRTFQDGSYAALDQAMGAVPGESQRDLWLRAGLFGTALFTRCVDRNGFGEQRLLQGFEAYHSGAGEWPADGPGG